MPEISEDVKALLKEKHSAVEEFEELVMAKVVGDIWCNGAHAAHRLIRNILKDDREAVALVGEKFHEKISHICSD